MTDFQIFMPASFVCGRCHFQLEKLTISAKTGAVGVRKGGESGDGELCPNDGQPMRRVTWKEAYEACANNQHEIMLALIESLELQSHYAVLLNMHDGGERKTFSSVATWIERLRECGKIPLVHHADSERKQ
jgi:hypothetical protein